jgi:hypothetical protein
MNFKLDLSQLLVIIYGGKIIPIIGVDNVGAYYLWSKNKKDVISISSQDIETNGIQMEKIDLKSKSEKEQTIIVNNLIAGFNHLFGEENTLQLIMVNNLFNIGNKATTTVEKSINP